MGNDFRLADATVGCMQAQRHEILQKQGLVSNKFGKKLFFLTFPLEVRNAYRHANDVECGVVI